jgi:UDPglucose 6-dehydrogenase
MRVTIFGSGYVGLVTGACLADVGNEVLCIDVDADKIARLQEGDIPIFEPVLESLIVRNSASGRIQFSTDAALGIEHGEVIFIAVGTPPDEDGSADLRYVLAVAREIGKCIKNYRVIVDKSTVPVGTAEQVRAVIEAELVQRRIQIEFDVISNPEFLKEGAAVADFMKPDRVVVGTESPRALEVMRALYAPFTRSHERLIVMDTRSAELTKYAANAMLATRISFMNELAGIAERVGADIEMVRRGIGSDSRIGYAFIYPGAGYGGSCFPKDVQALTRTAVAAGVEPKLLQAVESVNTQQKLKLFTRIQEILSGDLEDRIIALWGLAFKPNTDDMREAPSRVLMESLWEVGARVKAYDPAAMNEAARLYADQIDSGALTLVPNAMAALEEADLLAIVTEWQEFRSPDFDQIRTLLKHPVIVDGRNVFDPVQLAARGVRYFAIGRGESVRRVCDDPPAEVRI